MSIPWQSSCRRRPAKASPCAAPPRGEDGEKADDGGVIYARREAPEIEQREKNEEEVAELLALAERVEGIVRNVGMHAGGVLIAPGRITDFCPLYMQPGSESAVSQFDKDDVEAIGLVKFDFLGLATLTILELAKDFIVARHPERAGFDYDALPLDDRQGLRAVRRRPDRIGVPVRKRRHAAHAARGPADPARGPDRAERDVPPGADGEHPELLPAQERQGDGDLSASAARARARRDLRDHGLPGAGDAGGPAAGRLLARRRRPAAPGDGQEEARGDGQAPRHLPRGRGEEGDRGRRWPTRSST